MRLFARSLDVTRSCTVHVTGMDTGATVSATLTVNATRSA